MPRLTKRYIDALTAAESKSGYFVWDSEIPGFGVRVRQSGRKIYAFQFRDASGRTRRLFLGDHGSLTLDEARVQAARKRADAVSARHDPSKVDPAQQRRAARLQAASTHTAPTFADVADAFLKEADAKLKPSTVREYRRLLATTTLSRGARKGSERIGEMRKKLGHFKIAEISRAMISRLHLDMKDRPYSANRALATLSSVFAFAERHGFIADGSNPCRRISGYRESRRERLLTDGEYARLGDALRKAEREGLPVPPSRQRRRATNQTAKHRPKAWDRPRPANPVGVAAIRFLMLSGWRESEALRLQWRDVDFERSAVTLPDTKTGRSERELGAPALEVIQTMRAYRSSMNPFVFPGTKAGSCFQDIARIWGSVRHAASLSDVRLHDLRHAYASVGINSGLTLPVIGALLGHADSATTARYAHLADTTTKRAANATSERIARALDFTKTASSHPFPQPELRGEYEQCSQILPVQVP